MRKRHLFHLVARSPWPILSALSAFLFVSGLAFYIHYVIFGGVLLTFGLFSLGCCTFQWFRDVVDEATYSGYHTIVVCRGLRLGFMLFIASDSCYFLDFFEHFFMLR